jgi:hypothetical protein
MEDGVPGTKCDGLPQRPDSRTRVPDPFNDRPGQGECQSGESVWRGTYGINAEIFLLQLVAPPTSNLQPPTFTLHPPDISHLALLACRHRCITGPITCYLYDTEPLG